MWCNTQTPFLARGRYAIALGLPESQVRVIQTEVGGGFGGKSGDDNASVICALLARKAGRPVKLIHTREEEFLASHPRMPMRYWVRLGFRRDGRVMAKEIKMWADNGAYTGKSQAILGAASVRHDALYKYPCARAQFDAGLHQPGADRRVPRLRQPVGGLGGGAGVGPRRREARHRRRRPAAHERGRAGRRLAAQPQDHELRAEAVHRQGRGS